MSENAMNAALRRLGYRTDEMTAHGFRAMASTLLNECGKWHPERSSERSLTAIVTKYVQHVIAGPTGMSV